ncbi:MAG: LuxR C-terminal-related transcriptional regulator [Treponema sp.]|nr:LuxR C-terminal-related transcriptional regulator [Treponema sp.]
MKSKHSDYIKPDAAWDLLQKAKEDYTPVFIFGMTGYGKTTLVNQFLLNRSFIYYSASKNTIDEIKESFSKFTVSRKLPFPIVFDDLHYLNDGEERRKLIELAKNELVWPFFISRSKILDHILDSFDLIYISEKELRISDEKSLDFFSSKNLFLSEVQIKSLQNYIDGNPYALRVAATLLSEDFDLSSLAQRLSERFVYHLQNSISENWPSDLREFVLKISVCESFSVELAEYITQNGYASNLIKRTQEIGSFLKKNGNLYSFRPTPLAAFRRLAEYELGKEKIRELSVLAAQWYEENDELETALSLYLKAGRTDCIKKILVENSSQNPSNGHYIGLSRYYFEISKEEIESNVILMSGMSMLCSMLFRQEESEYWYGRILEAQKTLKGKDKTEAKRRIAYLDIGLPHRGSISVLDTIKSLGVILTTKGLKLPEFSVTSNLPFIMNGGKDFCQWSLKDLEIAEKYGSVISLVLGKNGKPLVNLALAESFYEKATDDVKMFSYLSRGQMETEFSDNLEMGFVAAVFFIRFYFITGNLDSAWRQLESFEKRCQEKSVQKFGPNIEAVRCRSFLHIGDTAAVDNWLKKYAPDENKEIYAMFRYQYLTKIRSYISQNRLAEALSLNEKIEWYSENYHRTYIHMECLILKAIIYYRNNEERWNSIILQAIKEASVYSFVRVFTEEGCAVLPLLKKVKKEVLKSPEIDSKWFNKILEECEKMALLYPSYLSNPMNVRSDFSDVARSILRLQMQGLTTSEIADNLSMKNETVRYHIKQNYKKLGVGSKSEAIIIARDLHLI